MTKPMFPPAVDSTFLAALRSCPMKAFRTYVEHWKPKRESVHLVAGGAFAKGLEESRDAFYVKGLSQQDAEAVGLTALIKAYGDFECPADSAKSLERMCGALEFYYDAYPFATEAATPSLIGGKRAIEFSFAEPLPILHPQTGEPLFYTGRTDQIVDFAGGVYVEDDKTASQLGASWGRQWEMRSQFTGYIWAAQQAGINAQGALVRGVSILKTKYDTQQAVTYRSPYELDRWYQQTLRDVKRAIQMWEEGYWDYNLDHACAEYAGCSLVQVCKSSSPEPWLEMNFEKRVWDPLARREVTVAEWEEQWLGKSQGITED